jgi:hypothetical protein
MLRPDSGACRPSDHQLLAPLVGRSVESVGWGSLPFRFLVFMLLPSARWGDVFSNALTTDEPAPRV